MKKLNSILLLTTVVLLALNCKNKTEAEIKTVDNGTTENTEVYEKQVANFQDNEHYTAAQFTIKGMTCAMGCAKIIEKKLAKMDGMYNAKVDFENELATVEFNAEKIDKDALVSAVTSVSDTYSVQDVQLSDQPFSVKSCKKECCAKKKECKKECKKKCCAKKC
ncbi:MAG: heavy-metal-associated domain-containing protein [Flavobacteriaceae bacterium]